MKLVSSDLEIIRDVMDVRGASVLDVGCGAGDLVGTLGRSGAYAVGLDSLAMLGHTSEACHHIAGIGESLPFRPQSFDLVCYMASYHHIPQSSMLSALQRASEVLTAAGRILVLEPIARPGSYFELIRLVEDEREIQADALQALQQCARVGLRQLAEWEIFYERKFTDYEHLIRFYVEDSDQQEAVLREARTVADRMAATAGVSLSELSFQSICRVNTLGRAW